MHYNKRKRTRLQCRWYAAQAMQAAKRLAALGYPKEMILDQRRSARNWLFLAQD